MMAIVEVTDGVEVDLASLHRAHYRDLVTLASFMVDDVGRCEELVQDAFANLDGRSRSLRDPQSAAAYLRSAVLNGARSALRRRDPRSRLLIAGSTGSGVERPDEVAERHDEEAVVLAALRSLPHQQQAVLVLRYWLSLTEAEIAASLGIRVGTVKTHARRGLAALAVRLEDPR